MKSILVSSLCLIHSESFHGFCHFHLNWSSHWWWLLFHFHSFPPLCPIFFIAFIFLFSSNRAADSLTDTLTVPGAAYLRCFVARWYEGGDDWLLALLSPYCFDELLEVTCEKWKKLHVVFKERFSHKRFGFQFSKKKESLEVKTDDDGDDEASAMDNVCSLVFFSLSISRFWTSDSCNKQRRSFSCSVFSLMSMSFSQILHLCDFHTKSKQTPSRPKVLSLIRLESSYLASAVELNTYWSKHLASVMDLMEFHRVLVCRLCSLSSASESWEAMAVRAFEETSNMLSREAILSNLVFVDKNLTHREKDNTSEKGLRNLV